MIQPKFGSKVSRNKIPIILAKPSYASVVSNVQYADVYDFRWMINWFISYVFYVDVWKQQDKQH